MARMRVVRLTENLPGSPKVIRLHHITDIHAGAPDLDEQTLRERIELIRVDPHARWTYGGDGGDMIRHNDRRYSPTELDQRYRLATDVRLATMEHLIELLDPIKEKCWGVGDGNHERAFDEHNGGKFGVELSCALGLQDRWVGYRGFIHVTFSVTKTQKITQLIDLQHGWQAGRLKGAPMVQAERELGMTEADIVFRGHNHSPAAHTFVTLGVAQHGVGVTKRFRTVINGGTWRKGYRDDLKPVDPRRMSEVEGDLWHETKGFRAEPTGGPVLILEFHMGGTSHGKNRPAYVTHSTIEGYVSKERLGIE